LKQRLKEAIANSKAIQNLADNPLLLTMMAILNRRQELPRDRADLYDQASRVLLYHWDVDHKRLQLPMDAIGRWEKQEMLRPIAYEMQAGAEGLKGNLISADRLTQILTSYLRDQGFGEPREKANLLIQQLRERNFILCYRGADTYGFMHRTFLEYFCAVEIVNRFEKQRSISFEELRDEVFGQHWQDETWHEVLRLICGKIDASFAEQLIELLLKIRVNKTDFLDARPNFYARIKLVGLMNLLLAADCLSEINSSTTTVVREHLLKKLKREARDFEIQLDGEAENALLERIVKNYPETLQWLKQLKDDPTYYGTPSTIPAAAVSVVAKHYRNEPDTLPWLKTCTDEPMLCVAESAFCSIAAHYCSESDTLTWLKDHAQDGEGVISVAYSTIAKYYRDDPETLLWLKKHLEPEEYEEVQCNALEAIAEFYYDNSRTFSTIKEQFYKQQHTESAAASVKHQVVQVIGERFPTHPETFEFMCEVAQHDMPILHPGEVLGGYRGLNFLNAIKILMTHYPTSPKAIELLRDRATNDPDEQLREWAQEQLKMQNGKLKEEEA